MELKIVYLPVGDLKPYERNARKHENADVQTIVNSIKQFGFRDPIGIWGEQNIIVEGHGRLLAAQRLGMAEVPCIRLDDMTDEQRRAYALAHNKIAEMSEWDFDTLDAELGGIFDIDMSKFGFDMDLDVDVTADELKGSMAEKYIVPPFSVLYANKPGWLQRKKAWVALGLHSEVGRGGNLAFNSKNNPDANFIGGGRTEQSIQEQREAQRIKKSKAYSDGLIDKMRSYKKV